MLKRIKKKLVIENYCELYFSFLSELKVILCKVALILLSSVKLSKVEALPLKTLSLKKLF